MHQEKKPGSGMLGGGMEPLAMPAEAAAVAAAGQSPRMLRHRGASTKRSCLLGCGWYPAQAPAAVAGNGEKGTDGGASILGSRADEVFAPAVVSSPAQDGSLPQQQGPEKVEAVAHTAVSPVAQNGALPLPWQQGSDRVDVVATPTTVSPMAQNCVLPQQGKNKVEELVALTAVSPAMHSGTLPHALPRCGLKRARQNGNRGANGQTRLLGDAGERNMVVEVAAPVVVVMESNGTVSACSVWNSDKEACLLAAEEQGHGGSDVVGQEVAAGGYVMKMGNITGGSELQRKGNGIAGSRTRRWLKSSMDPPHNKSAVSPVRKFPLDFGFTAVSTKISGDLEVSFPPGHGRAAVSTKDNAVLEVAPIGTFGPGCGRSAVNTTGNGDEGLLIEATMVNNGDALAVNLVLGGAASPTFALEASNKNLECKRMVDEGQSNAHNMVQVPDDSVGTKHDGNQQSFVAKAALSVPDWRMKRERSRRVARAMTDVFRVFNWIMEGNQRTHHKQPEDHHIDARSKVRKLLQLFQATYQRLTHDVEQGAGMVYLKAAKEVQNDPLYEKPEAIVGNIPGIEVGDEFHYRVELSLVGLHRNHQGGIDTSKVNGVPVAISIVASGGYHDELSSSGELIYTGSGGTVGGNKDGGDQKLERGNLALKNCIETKTPVRVIHGFKGQSRSEVDQSKGKQTSTFIYDGLYEVVKCWKEYPRGDMVFKYKLQRIAGQPEVALHAVKAIRKSEVHEGLCLPDISQGSERIPICVINTIDDMWPAAFKYITSVSCPAWYKKEPQKGCNCKNGCSVSSKCACLVKNGEEIPFTFDNAIVGTRSLIYECGPSCRCPPTCHIRVSQHGIKIPLEIFKTDKRGWGVRSLSSISLGSFICEYTGELLEDEEAAANRENDEYLFDIGRKYHDEELGEGLQSVVDVQSSTSSSKTVECFTLDAAKCGNVGRFINHSCSPNLYAQNVLWDHDDVRMPHLMFFAAENIPPLQELTCHYNYKVGQLYDKNGKEKIKHCYCGASNCCGRLY